MFAFTSNVPFSTLTGNRTRDTNAVPAFLGGSGRQLHAVKDTEAAAERTQAIVPNLAFATGFMAWSS